MSFDATYPHNLAELPPKIDFKAPAFTDLLIKARAELAELKGYCASMPNPMLLLSPAIIKESVESSHIENINTTVVDVLHNQLFPEMERHHADKEVLRYRDAILWSYDNLKDFSLSTRLIVGVQKKLIPSSHGNYRKLQNKIVNDKTGEVLYTPPLPMDVPRFISNWENFIHYHQDTDPLIKCAVGHYQFEAIHPFDDGNGRTGRILMVLQLIHDKILSLPVLYISGYINSNRSEYYKLLREITRNGNWNDFILFMLKGFYSHARETKDVLFKIMHLFFELKANLKKNHKKIYSADLVEALFSYPVITPVRLSEIIDTHYMTASRYLGRLAKDSILKEVRHGKYHLFINEPLMRIIKK